MRWWLAALVLAGCSAGSHSSDGSVCDPANYPCGPYGFGVGAVMENLTISGQRDLNGSGRAIDDPVADIRLADYFHDRDLKALAIIIGSESCVPCQNEQPDLVTLHQSYQGKVAILEAIVQNAAGAPADERVIDNWVNRFMVPFDMTADPTNALAPYYPANSFPSAMAVRLSDMQIVYKVVGPADGLKQALDGIP